MFLSLKRVSILLLTIWLGWGMSGCTTQDPIKIGFAGELTGHRAELGVGSRNGIQLAIEEMNAQGGINGRLLELIVEDDKGDPETARQVDDKLVKAGVVAIIGHITSGQTVAVLEQMNEAQVVLLSPTAASSILSNQVDYFFRVQPAADLEVATLAVYIYQTLQQPQISVVYDAANKAYTESFWQAFFTEFETLGGEVLHEFTFTPGQTNLEQLAHEIMITDPSALLLVSSDADTALLAQYIRLQPEDQPILISSSWAYTEELLAKGGQAIEDLLIIATYDLDNPNPAFQEFVQNFEARFEHQPDFGDVYGYEAMQVLAEALKQTGGEAEGLPEALINIKAFPAIQGSLSINEYGDVERDIYIAVVEEGRYNIVATVSSD